MGQKMAMKIARLLALTLVPLLMAAGPVWRGMAAGQLVVLTGSDLRVGPAGSLPGVYLNSLGEPGDGEEEHDASWKLLSIVGPLVSVETHVSGNVEGAAHPYAAAAIEAYDVKRGGKPAKLTDYFPAPPIYQALMGDKLVQTALAGKTRPTTLKQLIATIAGYQSEDCAWGFSSDLLTHFAFHHVDGKRVAVRFGLTHGCEVARGGLTIVAVYLPIPPALAADLAAARSGKAGFLVPAAPKLEAHMSRHQAGKRNRKP